MSNCRLCYGKVRPDQQCPECGTIGLNPYEEVLESYEAIEEAEHQAEYKQGMALNYNRNPPMGYTWTEKQRATYELVQARKRARMMPHFRWQVMVPLDKDEAIFLLLTYPPDLAFQSRDIDPDLFAQFGWLYIQVLVTTLEHAMIERYA